MRSLNIYFTGLNQVEVRFEPVGAPQGDDILVRAEASLISAGTEGICLSRKFEPGITLGSMGAVSIFTRL